MRLALAFFLLFLPDMLLAQQFIGMPAKDYTSILQMPYNPAYVTAAADGTEINVVSANTLIGTDAYHFQKRWVYGHFDGSVSGKAIEGKDYYKDPSNGNKHIWGNIDCIGPSASFRIMRNWYAGFFTRTRELINGGNLNNEIFQFIGDSKNAQFNHLVTANGAGFMTQVWGEAGLTVGGVLYNNNIHIWRVGATIKYLAGFNSASMFCKNTQLLKPTADSFGNLSAEIEINYTKGINNFIDNDVSNDIPSWFNKGGKSSVGFDFGVQYEYHPDYDPNRPTPYFFSIAASVNDIGHLNYNADPGSGIYRVNLHQIQTADIRQGNYETISDYLNRMVRDTLAHKTWQNFAYSIQLPTIFRLNFDVSMSRHFYIQTDVVLGMAKTVNNIFDPSYLNTFTITPRYESKHLMIGVPVTYLDGWRQMYIGTVARFGPLFIGSSSLISNALRHDLQALDGYMGITLKLPSKKKNLNKYISRNLYF